jgi:hypothetical protein
MQLAYGLKRGTVVLIGKRERERERHSNRNLCVHILHVKTRSNRCLVCWNCDNFMKLTYWYVLFEEYVEFILDLTVSYTTM